MEDIAIAESQLTEWVATPVTEVVAKVKKSEKKRADRRAEKLKETTTKLRKRITDVTEFKKQIIKHLDEKLDAEDIEFRSKPKWNKLFNSLNNAQTIKSAIKLIDPIHIDISEVKNRRITSKLEELLDNPQQYQKKQDGKVKARKLHNDERKLILEINKWKDKNLDDIAFEIAELESNLTDENIDRYVALQIAEDLATAESLLKRDKDANYVFIMDEVLGLNERALNELTDLINEGKSKLKDQIKAEAIRLKEIGEEGIEASNHKDSGKTNITLQREQFYDKWKWAKKIRDNKTVKAILSPIKTTTFSFEYLFGYTDTQSDHGKGKPYKRFVSGKNGIIQKDADFIKDKREIDEELAENINKILGKKNAKWKVLNNLKNVFKDYSNDREVNVRRKSKIWLLDKEGNRAIYDKNKSKDKGLPLSIGQGLYVHLVAKMPDAKDKLEKDGWDGVAFEQLEAFLGKEYVEVSNYITKFLKDKYGKYNKPHLELFRTDLGFEEGYFPTYYDGLDLKYDVDLGGGSFSMAGVTPGSVKQKVNNNNRIDISKNAFEALHQYVESMETFYHYGRYTKDLNALLNNKGFKNNVQSYDKQAYSDLVKLSKAVIGDTTELNSGVSKFEKDIYNLNSAIAGSFIAGRLYTAFKQVISDVAFTEFADMPVIAGKERFTFGLNKLWFYSKIKYNQLNVVKARKNFKFFQKESIHFNERMRRGNTGDEFVANFLESNSKTFVKSFFQYLTKQGIAPNMFMDAWTISTGGMVYYKQQFNKYKKVMSATEAKEKAIHDFELAFLVTQQSNTTATLSGMQLSKGALTSMFGTFKNAVFGYLRRMVKSGNNIVKRYNRKKLINQKLGMSSKKAGVKAFKSISKDAKTYEDMMNFVIYSHIMPMAWQFVLSGMPGIIGDWDEEDSKDMKRAAWLGAVNGVFIASDVAEFAYNKAVLGKNWVFSEWIVVNEMVKTYTDIVEASEESGTVSLGVAYEVMKGVLKTKSFNPDNYYNIYKGVEKLILDGNLTDEAVVDIINAPKSLKENLGVETGEKEGEDEEEDTTTKLPINW